MRMMQLLKSKVHNARITYANPDYIGSLEMDADLMEKAGLMAGEFIHIWNVDNGQRFETYTMSGERGSGIICVNGAAAHRARKGDRVIITSFCLSDEPVEPLMVLVDEQNRFVKMMHLPE
jgi:aspartate 1-decarboxylase